VSLHKAIIGGTGVYESGTPERVERVSTPYGTVELDVVRHHGEEIAFLARHGKGHSVPPHRINYRANLKALQQLGVTHILATAAVGSLNPEFRPGDLVLVSDFLDGTWGRPSTFFDGEHGEVRHVNLEEPYCPRLNSRFAETAEALGIPVHGRGVYVCTEGPRFETPAEIRMFRQWGASLVGMTNVPEVVLAKELGLCYAAVGLVVNMASGMESTPITLEEIRQALEGCRDRATRICLELFRAPQDQQHCACAHAVMGL
jgi:5'-methylthioadenosine phosphorylase